MVSHVSDVVWDRLAFARIGVDALSKFEEWVYQSEVIEPAVGEDFYVELISLDYRSRHAHHELVKLIERIYDARRRPGDIERDTARATARAYLAGNVDLVTGSRILAHLSSAGAKWVPGEFSYIDSELDDIPMPAQYALWNPDALARKLQDPRLDEFRRVAEQAARELLSLLEEHG